MQELKFAGNIYELLLNLLDIAITICQLFVSEMLCENICFELCLALYEPI